MQHMRVQYSKPVSCKETKKKIGERMTETIEVLNKFVVLRYFM